MLHPQTTINCRGRLIDFSQPKVMGVLNVTPDSFYDGGRYNELDKALFQVERMLDEGATFIDVGGMSSRPGAEIINADEELTRIVPIISEIRKRFPDALISVDTVFGKTVRELVPIGIDLVNDISAGSIDPDIFLAVSTFKIPYVLMHMAGQPKNMQDAPTYEDIVQSVVDFLIEKIGVLRAQGCQDIIVDPGFGFGKTVDHNYQLLKKMHLIGTLGLPVMTGLSRKSMIYKLLGITPEEALNGTSVLHMIALQQGSRLLRVHDVAPAIEVIKLWQQIEIQ